jgi:hypothetical protein
VKRTENKNQKCDEIKGEKREVNAEEDENNDNVNRRTSTVRIYMQVPTYSQ